MLLKFSKMHGLGNDFAVFFDELSELNFSSVDIQAMSHRHMGIGFDQLLIIYTGKPGISDFHYRIFNADGSEAGQCGNGVRCVARFLHENKLTQKNSLKLSAKAGVMTVNIKDYENIQVDMGKPILEPKDIPLMMPYRATQYVLNLFETEQTIMSVSMGNPHAVVKVQELNQAPVQTLGQRISQHEAFPEKSNVGFMEVIARNKIKLRVYERGVGETLACGTGACAAVVVGIINNFLDSCVEVVLQKGNLKIEWRGEGHSVMMTGPAVTVYTGQILWSK